ncbi:MAG: hypothetical protein HONBIEJF_00941 [Fimbriimonadaceae bacterium]|nr:hypothetical protein [Fimbriimonadaceae bacterium]
MSIRQDAARSAAFGFIGAALFAAIFHGGPAVAQNVKEFIVRLQDTTPGVQQTGNANISGKMIAGQLQGDGAAVTGLNASNLASGTLPDARLSGNVARRDQTNLFSVGPNQFNGFLGVGRSTQVTGAELFGLGNTGAGFNGMYIRTGSSGMPFYGYSINGAASAYSYVDGNDGGKWKLNVSGDRLFVTPGGFVGVDRSVRVTGNESFGIGNNSTTFDGTYIRTAATGQPFYGYSLAGEISAFHFVDGQDQGKWKLSVGAGTQVTVTPTGKVGLGTTTPLHTLQAEAGTNSIVGVYARTFAPAGFGLYGGAEGGNESYGVYGRDGGGDGYGVYSSGDFVALGNKSFQIDHPLDPENRYLRHYCTESPTPQNTYSGMAVTGTDGKAWVVLPDYFDAINKNVKYQLTVVDDAETANFVQAKVGREVRGNRFLIMTSAPGTKVSWRIEADRNDLWVRKHGAPTEREKPKHLRGTYQRPELYGMPEERGEHHHRLHAAGQN